MCYNECVDYMSEERAGYTIEMEQILKRLRDLADKCPSKFELPRKDKRRHFSLTPCPRPNLADYERKCSRLKP